MPTVIKSPLYSVMDQDTLGAVMARGGLPKRCPCCFARIHKHPSLISVPRRAQLNDCGCRVWYEEVSNSEVRLHAVRPKLPATSMTLMAKSYLEAALWTATNNTDAPLDQSHAWDDFTQQARWEAQLTCDLFFAQHRHYLMALLRKGDAEEHMGRDLWLTRNGHGAGFWDGDWEEQAGEVMSKAARVLGERSVFAQGRYLEFY